MGKFKDNKEKKQLERSVLEGDHICKIPSMGGKQRTYAVDGVYTASIQHDRRKEKKYPTQMHDIVAPGFLLLLTHTVYCQFR